MEVIDLELAIGESVVVGTKKLTLITVDDGEALFEMEDFQPHDAESGSFMRVSCCD